MARYDFKSPRLFLGSPLDDALDVSLSPDQSHYLLNVLRLKEGETVLLFNGRDGEWLADVTAAAKKHCVLRCRQQTRPQPEQQDLWYAFAPIKSARMDYMIQKAVEMGASRLIPIFTRRTQVARLNLDRMRANAIEAAEQCGILSIPTVEPEVKLERFLEQWAENTGTLVFCDEDAPVTNPITALKAAPAHLTTCVLIGPEGGFDPSERKLLMAQEGIIAISLGHRILRADTAGVAALSIVQATKGDWQ